MEDLNQKGEFDPELFAILEASIEPSESKIVWKPDENATLEILARINAIVNLPKIYFSSSDLGADNKVEISFRDELIQKYELSLDGETTIIKVFPKDFFLPIFNVLVLDGDIQLDNELREVFVMPTSQLD